MDRPCRPAPRLDGVEEADELLMPVALHAAADHRALQHVEGGEQGRGAVALVVVGHGAGTARLHRQAGLGAVERLDLRLLVDGQHHGMRRRIDVEPDDIAQLWRRTAGSVESLNCRTRCGCRPCAAPDALHRRDADADAPWPWRPPSNGWSRRAARPCVRATTRAADLLSERRDARRPGLVAQQPVDALCGEALLPAPDRGLDVAGPAHDRVVPSPSAVSSTIPARQTCFCGVLRSATRASAAVVGGGEHDRDPGAHAPNSHAKTSDGIPLNSDVRLHPLDPFSAFPSS